jgi:hypothetical protein
MRFQKLVAVGLGQSSLRPSVAVLVADDDCDVTVAALLSKRLNSCGCIVQELSIVRSDLQQLDTIARSVTRLRESVAFVLLCGPLAFSAQLIATALGVERRCNTALLDFLKRTGRSQELIAGGAFLPLGSRLIFDVDASLMPLILTHNICMLPSNLRDLEAAYSCFEDRIRREAITFQQMFKELNAANK